MLKALNITLLSILFLWPQSVLNAQPADEEIDIYQFAKPALSHFSNSDGLPVNGVTAIERDKRGFIWFGTQDGGAVFNGYEFKVVNMPNRLVSNSIRDITIGRDNTVWFATDGGGIHGLKGGDWITYDKSNGLESDQTRSVLETFDEAENQILWVGRRDGLSRFKNGKWEHFGADDLPDKRVRTLLESTSKDGTRSIWIGTYAGIAVWTGDARKVYGIESGLPGKIVFDLLSLEIESGETVVWAATDKGPAKFENGEWETFADVNPLLGGPARSLHHTIKPDGTITLWVGLESGGVAYLEGGKWLVIDENKGLVNNSVFALSETGSSDGSVWVANLGAGVTRFDRSGWRTIDDSNGLKNTIVFGVTEETTSDAGSVHWIATYGGGLAKFLNGSAKTLDTSNGLPSDFVQALLMVNDDNGVPVLYVGTEKGLGIIENDRFEKIPLPEGNGREEIWKLTEGVGNNGEKGIWVGTNGGLIWLSSDHRVKRPEPDMEVVSVRDVIETDNPNGGRDVWVGAYQKGLHHKRDGKWSTFTTDDGLPTNRVYSVAEIKIGGQRQVWLATSGGIAYRDIDSKGESFKVISTENSDLLPSDRTYQVFQDQKERIYVTTNKGVSRITPNASGDVGTFNSYVFTTKDGLPNDECVSGASYIDGAGRVWVGTVGGAAVLDAAGEYDDKDAEPLFLERAVIGGKDRDLSANPEIDYEDNEVIFEFVMPTNFRESATRYRTQLVGLEEVPTQWTREPRREFTFIPGGNFVFKVWGMDAAGNQSGPLAIAFRVHPPWWQRWWAILLFIVVLALIFGTVAYLVSRNRYRRMLEIERVRTRIATDLHDDVGASLSQISILSEVLAHGDNEIVQTDRQSLFSIAETSRDVVSSMSDMVWAIDPKRDNLRDAIQRMRRFASELLSACEIQFTFEAPLDEKEIKLGVDLRRQLYLIFKESINNAAKHSDCKNVGIELKKDADNIYLKVSDDGKGFAENGLAAGNGLVNMKSRAAGVGGNLEVESGPGKGTTIKLTVPIK